MLINRVIQLAMVMVILLWDTRTEAMPRRSGTFKIIMCGRKLGHFMSHVCRVYNSPTSSWDVPTVIEQPAPVVRRKRQSEGIADECCTVGCTWDQLTKYCSVINSDLLDTLDTHMIEDRSAEQETVGNGASGVPALVGEDTQPHKTQDENLASMPEKRTTGARREVGSARSRGYGSARRGRRCRCRRKRRTGRRRAHLMGNMNIVRSAARAAPVVGTVSPLLTWGRTLNTDLPQVERDRYAYVAVYTT